MVIVLLENQTQKKKNSGKLPFAVLLEDTVCLLRIYVHQSGNIGMSISLTDRIQTAEGNMLVFNGFGDNYLIFSTSL